MVVTGRFSLNLWQLSTHLRPFFEEKHQQGHTAEDKAGQRCRWKTCCLSFS